MDSSRPDAPIREAARRRAGRSCQVPPRTRTGWLSLLLLCVWRHGFESRWGCQRTSRQLPFRRGRSSFVLGLVHGVRRADRRRSGGAGGEAVRTVRHGDHARTGPPGRGRRAAGIRASRCPTAFASGVSPRPTSGPSTPTVPRFTDRTRAFNLEFPNPPDVVAHPRDEQELEITLEWCDANGYVAIPYGGGSSVVWGVNPPDDCGPCVTIALDRLDRVLEIDEVSRAARIQAGRARARTRAAAEAERPHVAPLPPVVPVQFARADGSPPGPAGTTPPTTPTSTTSSNRFGC